MSERGSNIPVYWILNKDAGGYLSKSCTLFNVLCLPDHNFCLCDPRSWNSVWWDTTSRARRGICWIWCLVYTFCIIYSQKLSWWFQMRYFLIFAKTSYVCYLGYLAFTDLNQCTNLPKLSDLCNQWNVRIYQRSSDLRSVLEKSRNPQRLGWSFWWQNWLIASKHFGNKIGFSK